MDIVVERALQAITSRINLSTGLVHPSDKGCTIELLRMLREQGYQLVSHEIYLWAANHGWEDRYALVLKKYVEEINAGKRHRIETGHWKENIIEQFQNIN